MTRKLRMLQVSSAAPSSLYRLEKAPIQGSLEFGTWTLGQERDSFSLLWWLVFIRASLNFWLFFTEVLIRSCFVPGLTFL
jgi:hypothetical protein